MSIRSFRPAASISDAEAAENTVAWRARDRQVHNERTKLLAAAIDRLATTVLTVGFVTPIAGRLFGMVVAIPTSLYATTCAIFAALAVLLHLVARQTLGGLQ